MNDCAEGPTLETLVGPRGTRDGCASTVSQFRQLRRPSASFVTGVFVFLFFRRVHLQYAVAICITRENKQINS
jgi:hypothetical protein